MSRLQIDSRAILQNYRHFAAYGSVIPVLKENAYGLGAERVFSLLYGEGVRLFACSRPEEALPLSGRGAEILLLTCIHDREVLAMLLKRGVTLAVESLPQAETISELSCRLGVRARVHLAIDTGLGRFGFQKEQTGELCRLFYLPNVTVCGIFTHFRSADWAERQMTVFEQVLEALSDFPVGLRHAAATSTALLGDRYRLDAVRIGSGLTGRFPGLQEAASLQAEVLSVRTLRRGTHVGYGKRLLCRDSRVAVIDAGTADGAFLRRPVCCLRALVAELCRGRPYVTIGGKKARVLGCPGLTHTMVDVTNAPCLPGDFVEISQTPVLVPDSVPRLVEN